MFGHTRSPIDLAVFSPSEMSSLLQYALDNSAYDSRTVQGFPVLRSLEPSGSLAIPRSGRCWTFNGTTQFATLGRRLTSGNNALTVTAWVKFSGSGDYTIAAEHNTTGNQRRWRLFQNVAAPGNLCFAVSADGTVGNFSVIRGHSIINDNVWHHVAATFASGSIALYVDGVPQTQTVVSMAGSVSSLFNNTEPLNIGANALSAYLPGSMKDIRIYGITKTAGEVLSIYNQHLAPRSIDRAGLLAGYWCEEESGTVGYDWSGNGNHLTLVAGMHGADAGVKYSAANELGYSVGRNLASSTDRFGSAWNLTRLTATINHGISPIGTLTADLLVPTAVAGNHFTTLATGPSIVAGTTYTASGYFKAAGERYVEFGYSNTVLWPSTINPRVILDLETGTITATRNAIATTVVHVGNGWYRVSITQVCSAGGSTSPVILVGRSPTVFDTNYTGDGVSGVSAWGIQVEEGTAPTVYTTASVTNNIGHIVPRVETGPTMVQNQGPLAKPATVAVPCVTGNGTDVRANLDTALSRPDSVQFWLYVTTNTTGTSKVHYSYRSSAVELVMVYTVASSRTLALVARSSQNVTVVTYHTCPADGWYLVRGDIAYTASGSVQLTVNGIVSFANGNLSGTLSSTKSLLLATDNGSTVGEFSDAILADLRVTTGGVETRIGLQAGPGDDTTNRTLWFTRSNGTGGVLSNAIVGGTVANIWANTCPVARDQCIENGGRLNTNGVFIPRIPNSNLCADGNPVTLTAGKHGNKWSRINRNRWGDPALLNIGIATTDSIAPSTNVQAVSVVDTQFRRTRTDGSDRYFAARQALTGSEKTNAEGYVT